MNRSSHLSNVKHFQQPPSETTHFRPQYVNDVEPASQIPAATAGTALAQGLGCADTERA